MLKVVNLLQLLVALYVVVMFVVVDLASGAMQMVLFHRFNVSMLCSSTKAQAFGASMATLCACVACSA